MFKKSHRKFHILKNINNFKKLCYNTDCAQNSKLWKKSLYLHFAMSYGGQ